MVNTILITPITMLTQTQLKIVKYLIDHQDKHFGIRELAKQISTVYYLVQRNVQQLKNLKVIMLEVAGKTSLVKLHPRASQHYLLDAEVYKRLLFYQKYPALKVLLQKIIEQSRSCFFVLLVFGSYAQQPRTDSDLDLLVIMPTPEQVDLMEKIIASVARTSTVKIHETIVTESSFITMRQRKELNVTQEAQGKHILIYGDQLYYKLTL